MADEREAVAKWTVQRWRSKRPRWGLEVLKRPVWKHSQIRVHCGRRHWTLMVVSFFGPSSGDGAA